MAEFFGTLLIIGLAITFLMIASMWRLFSRAGKPGWACIIPIYNVVVMLEIAGKPIWWLILLLIPFVNIFIGIWVLNMFVKSYGKTEGYTIGIIFLPVIFLPMLAFGSSGYAGPANGAGAYNPLRDYRSPSGNSGQTQA